MKSGGWALICFLAIGKILRQELRLLVLRVFVNIAKRCSLIGWSVIVKKVKFHLHLGHEELRKNIVETEFHVRLRRGVESIESQKRYRRD